MSAYSTENEQKFTTTATRRARVNTLAQRVDRGVKNLVRGVVRRLDRISLPYAARSQSFARLYYAVIDSSFVREQHATAAGRYHHICNTASSSIASVVLRRNIHRIEKGLSMTRRKDIFALDYLGETLTALENFLSSHEEDDVHLLKYAHDVLDCYFQVTRWSANAEQPEKFKRLQTSLRKRIDSSCLSAPVPYRELPRAEVSYEQFLLLTQQRCSVRNFLDREVPKAELEKAIAAAAQAPSACNRQPLRYIATLENPLKMKLAALPMGTAGYASGIPALLAVVGDLSAYPFERDRHVIYIDASLANMQLMLALEALGLASCSINWPDMEDRERDVARLLSLASYERVVMLIAVGYPDPDGLVPHSEKKTVSQLITYAS